MEFYETRAGRQFYESTMPRIAEEMTRLNANLEVLILLLREWTKKDSSDPETT